MSTIINATTTNGVVIQPDNSGSLVLQTNSGTTALTIDTSQNVGIGTASPLGKLNVSSASFGGTVSSNGNQIVVENSGNAGITIASGASSTGNIFFADSGDTADGFVQYDQSGRSMRFGTAAAEKMRIDSSGNLKLITSTSTNLFFGTSASSYQTIKYNDSDGSLTVGSVTGSAYPVIVQTGGSERMRIDSSGKLLVGGTSTSAGYSGFNQALIGASPMLKFQGTTNAWDLYNNGGASFVFAYNASDKASINQSTGAYTALSDINKKKDFEDSSLGLNAVMQLQPKLFRMIDDSVEVPKQLGFIAQEVKNIIPQAYVEQEGGSGTFIGLNFNPIVAVLTKAIQEQQAIITDLKSRIEALESK